MDTLINTIRKAAGNFQAELGLILGSGLNGLADSMKTVATISYDQLPGFHTCSTPGHASCLSLGYFGKTPVICLRGRPHYYEDVPDAAFHRAIQLLKALGCSSVLITNAAGSLRKDVPPGDLMLIKDHINFQGRNPLVSLEGDASGSHFVGMENAYDKTWRSRIQTLATTHSIRLTEGVYIGTLGPCFETPAEIRAFRLLGADAVGMSTIPEVIMARFYNLKVAVISAITNRAAGMSEETLTHDITLQGAQHAMEALSTLVLGVIEDFAIWNTPLH